MNRINILFLILLLATKVLATQQCCDTIIFKGHSYPVQLNLLEHYFDENPKRKPKIECSSTALWRGYIATFEIKDNRFCLKDIKKEVKKRGCKDCSERIWKSVTNKVFQGKSKVKASWFTGLIVLPYKFISRTDMAYSDVYERYTIFEIDKGDIKKEKVLNYKQYITFKEKQFQTFKKTDEYKKSELKLNKTWGKKLTGMYLKECAINRTKKIVE